MVTKTKTRISSLFFKYFLSYLLIFLIPFTIISLSFYLVSTNNLREAIIDSNMVKLEQVRDFVSDRMSELRNLAVRISLDNQLTPYKLSQPFPSKEGIKQLLTYETSNSLIDTLVLTFNDVPTLYSSRGTTEVYNLVSNIYPLAEEEVTLFIDELPTITEPTLRTAYLKSSGEHIIMVR